MRVVIIRHAIAVPRGTPGYADPERPLTERGAEKFRRAAAGLARVQPAPAAILTSPWLRALDTARIAARAWGVSDLRETNALTGEDLGKIQADLTGFSAGDTVALVGHEPRLSSLLGAVIGSRAAGRLEFKKGGAALVEIAGKLSAGGRLIWFLTPRILRELSIP